MQNGLEDDHDPSEPRNGASTSANDSATPTIGSQAFETDETSILNDSDNPAAKIEVRQNGDTSVENHNNGPLAKRRKTTDSRAVSPPWKKHTVDGPTSFTLDGKRKSARTNYVPLELQAQSVKRTTRAARHQHSNGIKSRYGGATLSQSSSASKLVTSSQAWSKSTRSMAKSSAQESTHVNASTRTPASLTPTKGPHKRMSSTTQTQSLPTKPSPGSPVQKRRPGRPPKQPSKTREPVLKKEDTTEDESESQSEDDEEDESDDSDDEIEEIPVDPNFKPQRLRFKVKMPTLSVQHPGHMTPSKKFSSFGEWVENQNLSECSNYRRLTDVEVKEEATVRQKIIKASQPGNVLSVSKCSAYQSEVEEEPPKLYAHRDHMNSHAVHFRSLLIRERNRHKTAARKLAFACEAKWKEKQPKTEEEIQQEQEKALDSAIEVTQRQCINDLVLKWDMLRDEVNKWRMARWEEEQEALGRQALNKVLEQSYKLLDERKRRGSSDIGSDEAGSEGDGEETADEAIDSEEDEQNMSSSASDEDDNGGQDIGNDDTLTAEELRQKYGSPQKRRTEGKELDEEPAPEEPAESLNLDDDSEDESEDESEDDSEGDSEDGPEDDPEDETEGSDGDEEQGLLGFFSKKELAEMKSTDAETESTEPAQKRTAIESSFNPFHGFDEMEDEDVEEVVLIPDASQVQTPSASNSEAPSLNFRKELDQPGERVSNLRKFSTAEDTQHVDPKSQRLEISTGMDIDRPAESNQDSLPVTPVSSKTLKTPVPSLLRGTLREYQHYGLDWLAGLYANGTNGILADEMGLGKTIQTISLLAHLAVHHEVWGPHLIVVPTSVMLNWEMEFKKFLPGFKILTYYGTQEERKQKRQGWLDNDKWNVVITSYQLVLIDQASFKRRQWHYMVLDEAHNIKNFRSQRWQTLLTFNTSARLLLTGTPLQNNLTELWSLMFFIMPSDSTETGMLGFVGLEEFTGWFKKPVKDILEQGKETLDDEGKALVKRLHEVLRPYLLRRLKADVEKQMPGKYEHVVYCKLSKRQRYLYDGFMSRTQTRETLASGNYLSIINCLMQLRKVCNHPDLFETRQIVTSYAMPKSAVANYEIKELLVRKRLLDDSDRRVSLDVVNLLPGANGPVSALDTIQTSRLGALGRLRQLADQQYPRLRPNMPFDGSSPKATLAYMENKARYSAMDDLRHRAYLTSLRSQRRPLYSYSLAERLDLGLNRLPTAPKPKRRTLWSNWFTNQSPAMENMVLTLSRRSEAMHTKVQKFSCVTPAIVAPEMSELALSKPAVQALRQAQRDFPEDAFHESRMRLSIAFPDKRLLQFDCGKLQRLDTLLRKLQAEGHRALIFTQMTKVLDILEQFLNIHGHLYLRLDGSTKVEQRQVLTERFNNDPRILAFILSSRSGGLGINLTGADTVIFYDLDWNPAMDKQCQDRCHRIGQTRDVHIYRFVSEYTIEANILRKANQKRMLDDVIIQEGDFTTDYFQKRSVRDVFEDDAAMHEADAEASAAFDRVLGTGSGSNELSSKMLEQAEDKEDVVAARVAEKEVVHADEADFSERTTPGRTAASTPKPLRPLTPHADGRESTATVPPALSSADAESQYYKHGIVTPMTDMAIDIFSGKEPIGVDRYMVEFLERELKDVPVQPPEDKAKKKKKKGGEHRVTRKR